MTAPIHPDFRPLFERSPGFQEILNSNPTLRDAVERGCSPVETVIILSGLLTRIRRHVEKLGFIIENKTSDLALYKALEEPVSAPTPPATSGGGEWVEDVVRMGTPFSVQLDRSKWVIKDLSPVREKPQ